MSNKHYTCPFSHIILNGRCGCKFSTKDCVAEKEFGSCLDIEYSSDCQLLYQQLRNNSNFVLNAHNQNKLSVAQQSKIKMGGLLSLQEVITNKDVDSIDDISTLIQLVYKKYSNFENIPFSELMPKISAFKFRRKF